jgi:hypothetical protein
MKVKKKDSVVIKLSLKEVVELGHELDKYEVVLRKEDRVSHIVEELIRKIDKSVEDVQF